MMLDFKLGYGIHKKCKTELHFKQIQGIRIFRENDKGKFVYDAYCEKCEEHFEVPKGRKTI